MVLQRKAKTSLLELLESHVRGTVPKVAIQTKHPTPLPAKLPNLILRIRRGNGTKKVKK